VQQRKAKAALKNSELLHRFREVETLNYSGPEYPIQGLFLRTMSQIANLLINKPKSKKKSNNGY